jgi:hypothetical protein
MTTPVCELFDFLHVRRSLRPASTPLSMIAPTSPNCLLVVSKTANQTPAVRPGGRAMTPSVSHYFLLPDFLRPGLAPFPVLVACVLFGAARFGCADLFFSFVDLKTASITAMYFFAGKR